jgi:hypothetical protein
MNVWKNKMASELLMKLYPRIVQPIIIPHMWKLDKECVDGIYKKYTGEMHLEIGAGPNSQKHRSNTTVHYLDCNMEVLLELKQKGEYNIHYGSLLNEEDYPMEKFDSVACMNVMHCIPDPNKWAKLFYNTNNVLKEDGVIFGSCVKNNNIYSQVLNMCGVFHNVHDTNDVIELFSKRYFDKIHCGDIGNCSVFILKKKKKYSDASQVSYTHLGHHKENHHNDRDWHSEQQSPQTTICA